MNSAYIIWALIALASAAVLLVLELLIPSGGILGIAVAIATVTGIVLLFMADTTLGLTGALVVLLSTPFVLGFALRIWPHTPVAKWLTLKSSSDANDSADSSLEPNEPSSASSLSAGTVGVAITDLRPVGFCRFESQRVECLAEYGVIRAGTAIQIVRLLDDQTIVAPAASPGCV